MNKPLSTKLQRLLELTSELALSLNEEQYRSRLANVPSNTIGGQLWCIVGARESYLSQLEKGGSFEFTCSVADEHNKLQVMKALHESTQNIMSYLESNSLDERQESVVLDILQHEAQHHGQLIRYVYGNKWKFPQGWNEVYTV